MGSVYIDAIPFQIGTYLGGTITPYVYVADAGNHRIQCFDYEGNWLFSFGSFGTGPGEFNNPYGVCSDDEYVWVTDSFNNRIQKFTLKGVFVWQIGNTGNGELEFDLPKGITVDDDFLYVVDQNNHRIQIVDKRNGNFDYYYGSFGVGEGQFNYPTDIVVDSSFIYIDDTGNGRIVTIPKVTRYNYANIIMPMHIINASETDDTYIGVGLDIAIDIPSISIEMELSLGINIDINIELPYTEVVSNIDEGISIFTPPIEIAAELTQNNPLDISINSVVPAIEAILITTVILDINIEIPSIEIEHTLLPSINIDVNINMTEPLIEVIFDNGYNIDVNIEVPILTSRAILLPELFLDVTFDLIAPVFNAGGVGFPDADIDNPYTTIYNTIVVNTKLMAISQYNNFDVDGLGNIDSLDLCITSEGLHALIADDDNDVDIDCVLEFPTIDLHSEVVKRIEELEYMGRNSGKLDIQLRLDEIDLSKHYPIEYLRNQSHAVRVKFAKGYRNRLYNLLFTNKDGANFDINTLRIQVSPDELSVR